MELPTEFHKQIILEKFFKAPASLTLDKFEGFKGDKRVYINHNLSKTNYIIHKEALSLKKNGKISKIKIESGLIKISTPGNKGWRIINNMESFKEPNLNVDDDNEEEKAA